MQLAGNIFDVWAFVRRADGPRFLLLHTSPKKAERYFNGGRFWQVPSGNVNDSETMVAAIDRVLGNFSLRASAIWAAEHSYVIYNRRFEEMQAIAVFAAQTDSEAVTLTPAEHSEYQWCSLEQALDRVHYRGLKDGLRSVHEYVTGVPQPAVELCLRATRVA